MPSDDTYIHLIDLLGVKGPEWLFVGGLLVILAFVAVKALPVVRDLKQGQLDISRQREIRKADEARMRDDRDRENAANASRMVDAMNRQSESSKAMAAALNAVTVRLDASQGRSEHMGRQVDEVHDVMGTMAQQVGEIHAVTVRSK